MEAVWQRRCIALHHLKSLGAIKRLPGQRRYQFKFFKAAGSRGCLANLEDTAADPAPRPAWIHKKGPDTCGILFRVKLSDIFAGNGMLPNKVFLRLQPPQAMISDSASTA